MMTPEERYLANRGLIYTALKSYFPKSYFDEDLRSAGAEGLWKACLTYDENKGVFSSYAMVCILNDIKMELRTMRKFQSHGFVVVSMEDELARDGDNTLTIADTIEDPRSSRFSDRVIIFAFIEEMYEKFSKMEKMVLNGLLDDKNKVQIAKDIGVSQSYVSRVVKNMQRKFARKGPGF